MSTGVSWGRWPRYEQRIIALTNRFDPLPQADPMLVFGNGRSYGDVCLNAGGTLLAARISGTTIDAIPEFLLGRADLG